MMPTQVVGPVVKEGVNSTPSSLLITQAEPAVWSLEEPHCGNYPASTLRHAPQPHRLFSSGRWCVAARTAAQHVQGRGVPANAGTHYPPLHTGRGTYAGRSD